MMSMDSSFSKLKPSGDGSMGRGYVQPPPIQSQSQIGGSGNLYPTFKAQQQAQQPQPAAQSMLARPLGAGLAVSNPMQQQQKKISNIGTINVAELKKLSRPLDLAAEFIDNYLEKDKKFPELDRIIMQGQSSEYLFAESPYDLGALVPFQRTNFVNIPDAIFDQYNQTECYTRMGIFPEIERAWITVDNRLYFWNYKSGEDFLTFEDITHTIIGVSLVKPKPGTFTETVNYLLVLSTPLELYILAVADTKTEFQLYDTGMVVSTKGIDVNNIVGSDKTGRIFFSGHGDGVNIWEVVYSNVETWFRGKSSKVCHTRNGLAAVLMPSFSFPGFSGGEQDKLKGVPVLGSLISPSAPEYITQMVVDDSRSLLYTLSSKSTVRVYHMGSKNDLNLSITYTVNQMLSHLQMINAEDKNQPSASQPQSQPSLIGKNLQIVSIHAVQRQESAQIHLIAISSTGCRLYLRAARSLMFGFNNSDAPPTTMQVIQIRFPPSSEITVPPNQSKLLLDTKPTSRIFEPGHFFSVVPQKEEAGGGGDRVFVSSLDTGRVIHQLADSPAAVPPFCETACFLPVEGYVQAVALISKPFQATNTPEGFGNECAAQYTQPASQIAILTNTGVHIFTRQYPSQIFENLGHDVRPFYEIYGRAETCANALSVASRATTTLAVPAAAANERDFATKVYIELGGKPFLRIGDEVSYAVSGGKEMYGGFNQLAGAAAATAGGNGDMVRLSGRFDGLATYVSRIVRNIWTLKVFKITKQPDSGSQKGKEIFSLGADKKSLEMVQLSLFEVSEFLERNRAFIDGLMGGLESSLLSSSSRADELAQQAEHRGLDALVKLVKSIREGIAFLLLLLDETANVALGIEAIMSYLTEEHRKKMSELTFKSFFTTAEGIELAKELVTCLVNRSIAEGVSVDTISKILQDRCEGYCSSTDVITYKALEYLRKAKVAGANDNDLKIQNLNESVRMFQRAAGAVHFETLKEAINEFVDLKYFPGAVQIALSVASEVDRGNLALGYLHEGKQPGDNRSGLYEKRLQIYQLIFNVLSIADVKADDETASETAATDASVVNGTNNNSELGTTFGHEPMNRMRDDTYAICFNSNDEVFHYAFYDWFLSQGLDERLLSVKTPYILPYLRTNAKNSIGIADLLWVYSFRQGDYYGAAEVLLDLVRSDFDISLSSRIEYLSRASGYTNSELSTPMMRQAMLQLQVSIQELLEIAVIQYDILQAVAEDDRFEEEQRELTLKELNGKIMSVSDLFNDYADPLEYYEICLAIFEVSDHRGSDEITRCWSKLIQRNAAMEEGYEHVSSVVQRLGQKFKLSEFVFPTDYLVPQLEIYALEQATPRGWVIDTFLNAGMTFEQLYHIINDLMERQEHPFDEPQAIRRLASDLVYLIDKWNAESRGRGPVVSPTEVEKLHQMMGLIEK
ncbi:nucleoporin Nup170p [Trichomonascus vanleenenianus]|uniref:Nup170p n=1 Tax=Trichomonascus vanleenenianus TaxID=2268995 RepID=UPI003ECA4FA3